MGFSYRYNGSYRIRDYWPDDDENTIYLTSPRTLEEIYEAIEEKWGDVYFPDIRITSDTIHTRCLDYDIYDSSDYTEFIIIEKLNAD